MRYRFLRFPDGREKALTLSYDDGTKFDRRLIQIANEYGIKVTLNICSGMFGATATDRKLTSIELQHLAASGGHELAVHGDMHVALGKATAVNGIKDALDGREKLEKIYKRIIRGYAYADTGISSFTEKVTKEEITLYLKQLGFSYARSLTAEDQTMSLPQDWYDWNPTVHHNSPLLFRLLNDFLTSDYVEQNTYLAKRTPKLFYLWGHSYEFDEQNNWERFETFCETAGSHPDVWYATNIEICDYVRAYDSLIFSVDNRIIYNPTVTDVWFESDGVTHCVKAGETLRI